MRVSHFTLRSWFRTLLSVALAWVVLGSKVTPYVFSDHDGRPAQPSEYAYLQRVQSLATQILNPLMTVLALPPGSLQSRLVALAPRPHAREMTAEERDDEYKAMVNKYEWLLGQYAAVIDQLNEKKNIGRYFPMSDPKMLVIANRSGGVADPSVEAFSVDKGANYGIEPAMVALKYGSIIGRIQSVTASSATVLLTTDGSVKIQARLVRETRDGLRVIAQACLIHGTGNKTMTCDTISAVGGQAFVPAKGDLLVLADEHWPAGVQNAVLGEVVDVGAGQGLVYHLTIVPRLRVASSMDVVILLQR